MRRQVALVRDKKEFARIAPLHVEDRLHLQQDHPVLGIALAHECGLVLALNGVMICLFELMIAHALRGWPVRLVLALGYLLMSTSFLIFHLSATFAAFVWMMVVFTLGEMAAFSRQQAYAASLSPEHMRGRYVGFLGFAWCAGNTASSALGMMLFDRDPATLWTVNAMLGLLAAALILAGHRARSA